MQPMNSLNFFYLLFIILIRTSKNTVLPGNIFSFNSSEEKLSISDYIKPNRREKKKLGIIRKRKSLLLFFCVVNTEKKVNLNIKKYAKHSCKNQFTIYTLSCYPSSSSPSSLLSLNSMKSVLFISTILTLNEFT